MDPHSRHSQFNQRGPKAGPSKQAPYEPPPSKASLLSPDKDQKRTTPSRKSSNASVSSVLTRPIATNSRVKRKEQTAQELHLSFINNAFEEKAKGNSKPFQEIVETFKPKIQSADAPVASSHLRLWLLALSHVVSRLQRSDSALVEAIISMPWATMDTAFVKTYSSFIGVLLSARPEYLSLVLSRIAQGFTYQNGLQVLNSGPAEGSSHPLTRRVVYDRLHYLLHHILKLIPTLANTLETYLVQHFPHKRQSQAWQITYIRNLLRVIEYCPELADRMLALIVDRAIQIDVEIQVELEELEEVAQDHDDVFELDPFETIVGQDPGNSSSDDEEAGDGDLADDLSDLSSDAGDLPDDEVPQADLPADLMQVQEMVRKLDAILHLLFSHYENSYAASLAPSGLSSNSSSTGSDSSLSLTAVPRSMLPARAPSPSSLEHGNSLRRTQFHTLLTIFDRTIIRTFKSRYTQFLLFWFSSLNPEYSDLFQGMLISKALIETDQPVVTRAAAASYIASFVSRATFVGREGVRKVVALLCNFLRSQIDTFELVEQKGMSLPSAAHHSIFYAVAQAVFLVFCFRWRDLMVQENEEEDEYHTQDAKPVKKWMVELDVIQRVVTSPLNPLKVCSQNVVAQFARIAHSVGFIYCYPIMETNKKAEYTPATTPTATTLRIWSVHSVTDGAADAELSSFFPFDPYNLPRSGVYVRSIYREWSSVALEVDDEDEDDEDEDDDEHEDDEKMIPRSSGPADDGLGTSFQAMSISPAQPVIRIG